MSRWITGSEIRLALRLIAKQPVLSLTIVVALATGMCLATIGFTLREAVLYSSLPFANGDRFVRLVMHSEADDNVDVDLDGYHAMRDTSHAFVHLGAEGVAPVAAIGIGWIRVLGERQGPGHRQDRRDGNGPLDLHLGSYLYLVYSSNSRTAIQLTRCRRATRVDRGKTYPQVFSFELIDHRLPARQ